MAKCKRKGTVVQKQKENIRRVYLKGWFSFRGTVEGCTYAGERLCRMCMSVIRKCMHMLIAYLVAFFRISNHYIKGVL